MTAAFAARTAIELIIFIILVIGVVYEKRLAEFEQRTLKKLSANLKRKILK